MNPMESPGSIHPGWTLTWLGMMTILRARLHIRERMPCWSFIAPSTANLTSAKQIFCVPLLLPAEPTEHCLSSAASTTSMKER